MSAHKKSYVNRYKRHGWSCRLYREGKLQWYQMIQRTRTLEKVLLRLTQTHHEAMMFIGKEPDYEQWNTWHKFTTSYSQGVCQLVIIKRD